MSSQPRAVRALLSTLLLVSSLTATPARAALTCGDLPDLTTLFLQKHVRHRSLTPEIRDRAVQHFLQARDPQRVLFLDEDVKRIERDLRNVFHETRAGDCSRLRAVHADVIARHLEIEGFVRGFVGHEGYALDENAEIVIDVEVRGYPKTSAERDALLRALAHFQISNYLGNEVPLAEARERLIHRYELRRKRAEEIDREDLYALFLDGFARALDPHTGFLSAEVFEDFRIQMQLSLEGIGVALMEDDGFAVVREIIAGGATDRAKALQPDDRIIAVAEEGGEPVDIIDMALRDVVRLVRGKKGTRVHLTVLRGGNERLQVAITRDKIDLAEQAAKLEVHEVEVDGAALKLGLLELPSFYGDGGRGGQRQGSRDVMRLLNRARRERLDGIVLDLSRNGGGLLDDAVRITGFFIREGGVVAVQNTGDRSRVLPDPDRGIMWPGPLVVLTSRVSASASEILAGAMKDYGRAVIVGDDHTFGKGTVQSMIELPRPDLGALKVTTGLFYRPGGASTQLSGVKADVVLPSLLASPRIGEMVHENALPGDTIPSFRTPQSATRRPAWRPIGGDVLAEIARRSSARVAGDEKFQELVEEIAERDADDGTVSVAEINANRAENGADDAGGDPTLAGAPDAGDADADDEEPTLHQREALRILADLVQLSS